MELPATLRNGSRLYQRREQSIVSRDEIVVHLIGAHRIGDWYPERNIFQILIAINSGGDNVQMFFSFLFFFN